MSTKKWPGRKILRPLLTLTHHEKAPTDSALDETICKLKEFSPWYWKMLSYVFKQKCYRLIKYYKLRTVKLILFISLIAVISYLISTRYIQPTIEPQIVYVNDTCDNKLILGMTHNTTEIFIQPERSALTKDNLDYFASELGIRYWYIVRQQIIIETGLTSESCKVGHNLFGMKLPGQRETTAIGEYLGHARYKHWVYSLYDYKLWQDVMLNKLPINKNESYYDWLIKIKYAENPSYKELLKTIIW